MNRYEEINSSIKNAKDRFHNYRKISNEIGQCFFDDLTEYLSCPSDKIKLRPCDGYDDKLNYNIRLAMVLCEDGFWNFGINIYYLDELFLGNELNTIYIKVIMNINIDKKVISIKINELPDNISIELSEERTVDFMNAYDYIYKTIINDLQNGLDDLINCKNHSRIIGFNTNN